MSLAAPPPARLKARTEFSITLEAPAPQSGASGFRVEYREASEPTWATARTIQVALADKEVLLDDLNPTSTYEIRIYALQPNGEASPPSEVAAVDTDVPGCTPEPKCIVQ